MCRPTLEHPLSGLLALLAAVASFLAPVSAADSKCGGAPDDANYPSAVQAIGFGARTFGGLTDDRGLSIAATASGGFIVGGQTTSFGSGGSDLWLLTFDASGRLESELTDGIELDETGGHVVVRADGEVVIVGQTERRTPGSTDVWLLGTGPVRQRTLLAAEDDAVAAIEVTPDGGVVLAGATKSFGAGSNGDIWIVKLTDPDASSPVLDWQVSLGTPEGLETSAAIQPTADQRFVVAGTTTAFGAINQDLWLVKLDSTGSTIVWQRTYGGTDVDRAADMIETSDGDLVVAGTSYSFQVAGLSHDAWIARLDSSGNIIWQFAYGTATDDYVSAIAETSDGGIVVVGSTGGADIADPTDGWIMKLSASGEIVWQKRFLGTATEKESFADVAEVSDGNLVVVGRTESFGVGGSDLLLVALDLEGRSARCAVLEDWNATRAATSVVPVDTWDTPVATTANESMTDFGGEELASVERDMCSPSAFVGLARSGQTTSYHLRDDGDLRPGVAWPDPRFVDNADGTVTDLLTGLTWLKDADCAETIGWDPDGGGAGSMVWDSAVEFANEINSGVHDISACASYSAGATDWRLANIFEVETLMHCGAIDPAGWLETVGFENVHSGSYGYWSSSLFGVWDRMAIRFDTGELVRSYWSTKRRAWPVRGGQQNYPDPVYPANTPKTGQISTVWEGDDGDLQMGVLWPHPRFRDHGDGTVTDELTGLRWLKDADCFGLSTWDDAFVTLADFNANPGSYACTDYLPSELVWRLPNRKEFLSLIEYLGPSATLPAGHPFVNTSNYHLHWTSTTVAHRDTWAWQIYTSQGIASLTTKTVANDRLWPVVDTTSTAVGAGRVPDNGLYPGTPLTAAKAGGGQITLSWGASCLASDVDYVIYEGTIPYYDSHGPAYCSTGGLTTKTFAVPSGISTYYLIVPINENVEGSYGLGAGDAERGPAVWPCLADQNIAACP